MALTLPWTSTPNSLSCFFLFLSNPAHGDGAQTLRNVLNILDYLGVPVSTHKIEGPSTSLTFLGIEIDTMSFELYLPASKVICIKDMVKRWLARRACTCRELKHLLGHLVHAATIIRPGHTFLRTLFALLHRVKLPHHFILLIAAARADLCWWDCFLQQ